MAVVSNTPPISNLAKVGCLELLQSLYSELLIPNAVYAELLDTRAGEIVISAVRSATWLHVQPVQDQTLVKQLQSRINLGEAEAIILAVEVRATRLLIDERLGRQAAADLGLRITGVLGVLLLSKRQNLIDSVKPILDELIDRANFRISAQLYSNVLDTADE